MKSKQLLKFLDATNRVLGRLWKITLKAYRIAKLVYDIYQILGHR